MSQQPLLHIDNVSLTLPHNRSRRRILDQVSLKIHPGEVVGLVGESGSGKTITALATMGLLPRSAAIESGHIWFDGQDLLTLSEKSLTAIRGRDIAMIFQNPRASLNPLMRVGKQIARILQRQENATADAANRKAIDLMQHVGIPDPASRMRAYPHQLSGGMAQRVLIAMMLACKPRLLIADEPTTSLDVTIQAQIFELMKEIRAETGAALLLITHDLGVVSDVCERVAVMYAGQMMELASVHELFASPQHPYTNQLMSSILRVDQPIELDANYDSLAPSTRSYQIPGCRFAERCLQVHDICWQKPAPVASISKYHHVNCHLFSSETDS